MLNEPLSKRYRNDGKENFVLTSSQFISRDLIAAKIRDGYYLLQEVNCPLCGCLDTTCLSEKDTYGLPVKVVACNKCGFLYNNPRLDQNSLSAFYIEDYRNLDRVLPNIDDYFRIENEKGKRIYQFLKSSGALNAVQGKLVVEVGCGAGGVLGYFQQMGYSVIGCDLVPANLEFGRSEKNLNLYYGTLQDIKQAICEKEVEVGLIIYEQVFEHLPNPSAELKIIHDIIGPKALLYIGVPGVRNIDDHYNSDFLRFLQLPHLMHFDLSHLVALLEVNRFEYMVGNEIVQAVFTKSSNNNLTLIPTFKSTMSFITELESRRKRRAVSHWVRNFPRSFAFRVIQYLPMPRTLRDRLSHILRQFKKLTSLD